MVKQFVRDREPNGAWAYYSAQFRRETIAAWPAPGQMSLISSRNQAWPHSPISSPPNLSQPTLTRARTGVKIPSWDAELSCEKTLLRLLQGPQRSARLPDPDLFPAVFQLRKMLSGNFCMVGENLLCPALLGTQNTNSPAHPNADIPCMLESWLYAPVSL